MTAPLRDRHQDPGGDGVEWGKDKKLSQAQQIATLRSEVGDLRHEMHELTESVQGLLTAWRTATAVIVFIKWTAAVGAALVSIKLAYNQFKPTVLRWFPW